MINPRNTYYVPSFTELTRTVVHLCENKQYLQTELLMQHLFIACQPNDMHIIYLKGVPMAQVSSITYMQRMFRNAGVYKCLLNT